MSTAHPCQPGDVGREGIGFWGAEKATRANPCLPASSARLSSCSVRRSNATFEENRCCARGPVEGAGDWNIGQDKRAASAARIPQSKGNPRAGGHDSRSCQSMPAADASGRRSGREGSVQVLIGFWVFGTDRQRAIMKNLTDGTKKKIGEDGASVARAHIHTCQTDLET